MILLKAEQNVEQRIKTERIKTILQRFGKLLLQEKMHINHVFGDRLKNRIEQLKGNILGPITSCGKGLLNFVRKIF